MIDQRLIKNIIGYNLVTYKVKFETKTSLSQVMLKFYYQKKYTNKNNFLS